MAGRTIIIASHAVESLAPLADTAIFLEDGTAKWQGPGQALLESEYMAHLKTEGSSDNVVEQTTPESTTLAEPLNGESQLSRKGPQDFVVQRAPLKTPRQILVDENKIKGAVDIRHWVELMKMNGGPLFFVVYVIAAGTMMITPLIDASILR